MQKLIFLLVTMLAGCTPMIHPPGEKLSEPYIADKFYRTEDSAFLPLRHWLPTTEPKAVLVALHGFNDYSNFFDRPGIFLSRQGIACYAYDQRGFGDAPMRGLWAGIPAYTDDLRVFVWLIRHRYPHQPIYVLGESMGGAVVIATLSQAPIPGLSGTILVAPALWARQTMPWYQTGLLWTLAHTFPRMTLTGKSVGVKPSDNIEMLKELGRDPLTIKSTRVEAIYGLTNLMDSAFDGAQYLQDNTLILYGENDELIPKKPTYDFLRRFLSADNHNNKKIAFYEKGYHMLLRDLNASIPQEDIAAWINDKASALPSAADQRASEILGSASK